MDQGVSLRLGGGVKRPQRLAVGMKAAAFHKPAAFAADSDDEGDQQTDRPAKRPRSTPAEPQHAVIAAPDPEVRKVADKLAEFVAKNGRNFEEVTRSRNTADGLFRFLYEKTSPGYAYYDQKVREYKRQQTGQSLAPLIPPPIPPPAPPPQHLSILPDLPPPQQPLAAAPALPAISTAVFHREPTGKVATGATGGDSIAAMEAFAAAAKRLEESRDEQEARVEHLNETSFDRRRKVAVYKSDGRRGHHMQDFIPVEELAAHLAKTGDKQAAAQAAAIEKASQLGTDNVGHRLLAQMGWKEGQGLGANAAGIAAPVSATGTAAASEKRGLGAKAHGEVEEGDDAFEVYRKRMMLGYKHRPNPLGNPRKAYY